MFPEKTLDFYIEKIHEHQYYEHHISFAYQRMQAEDTDKKLRNQLRSLMIDKDQYGLLFPFVNDFTQCMNGLSAKLHLLEEKDDHYIDGFLNTMDRYMQMIEMNYPDAEIDPAYRKMKMDVEGTIEEFRIKLNQSQIEKGFKAVPTIKIKEDKLTKRDMIQELVPEKPKIKVGNSRDFEI